MTSKTLFIWCLAIGTLAIYLFVSAPVPLAAEQAEPEKQVPIERALALLNAQNESVRALYAQEIVADGKKQGLDFSERWRRNDVNAGPLPALFLRETAFFLEGHPTRLSLFLGSDLPINKSNRFVGTQSELFEHIRETHAPESFYSRDTDLYFAMFPDVAAAEACVTCHNEHPDSPKKDWKLGDVMGATTWSHPSSQVSVGEVLEMSDALLEGIDHTYGLVLEEMGRMQKRPRIGKDWPRDGYQLPSREAFMKEVSRRTAGPLLEGLLTEVRKHHAEQ